MAVKLKIMVQDISRECYLYLSLKKKNIKKTKIIFLTRKENNFHLGHEMIKKSKKKIYNCADKNLKPNSKEEMNLFKKIDSDLIIIDRLFYQKKQASF